MWLFPCPLPHRILHFHQKAAVVGAAGVVEVEILLRLQSPETVTAVVKLVTMCVTVLSGTRTGSQLLMVLSILLPRCIAIREINWMFLCPIAMSSNARVIIMPHVTTLGRLPRLVLLVLVVTPPLLWLMLEVGII